MTDSNREYTVIKKNGMEMFLSERLRGEWSIINPDVLGGVNEYVYGHRHYKAEEMGAEENRYYIMVFSTIDRDTDISRKKGSDAIRNVIWDKEQMTHIGGREKTLRIGSWRSNLREKIRDMWFNPAEYMIRCDECAGWMSVREGKYGEFLGCNNYPDCENTKQID